MVVERLRVVHVEDNPSDAALVRRSLHHLLARREGDGNFDFHLHWVDSLRALSELEHDGLDVALVDLNLGESVLMNTLEGVRDRLPEVPIVVLTAVDMRSIAVECLRHGADDVLTKNDISPERLARAILMAHLRHRRDSAGDLPGPVARLL